MGPVQIAPLRTALRWSVVPGEEMPANFEEPFISVPIVPECDLRYDGPVEGQSRNSWRRAMSNPYASRPPGRRGALLAAIAAALVVVGVGATAATAVMPKSHSSPQGA